MKHLILFMAWFALPWASHSQDLSELIEDLESRVQFGLFTDFQTEFNDEERDAEFYSGHVVGHITATLSRRLQYFAEITLSPELGVPGQANLERAFFKFFLNDQLQMRFGRIHTPVSLWNQRYHHGQYLQTSVNRPQVMVATEHLTPMHSIVAEVGGSYSTGAGSFLYRLGAGATEDHVHEPGESVPVSKNPSFYTGFEFEPSWTTRWLVGAKYYRETMDSHHEASIDAGFAHEDVKSEEVLSGHIRVETLRWALMAEHVLVAHSDKTHKHRSTGSYVQAEYQLAGFEDRMVVYGRFETLTKDGKDPLFMHEEHLAWRGVTSGVRLNVAPRVALTTELRLYGQDWTLPNHHLYVQLSAAF